MRKNWLDITGADGAVIGRYKASGRGYGFVIPDGGGPDLFVPPGLAGGAWPGDSVAAVIDTTTDTTDTTDTAGQGDGPEGAGAGRRGPAGRVTAILARNTAELTGRLHRGRGQGDDCWVAPDDNRLPERIVIPRATLRREAADGEKVAVRMTSYGDRDPKGRIKGGPRGGIKSGAKGVPKGVPVGEVVALLGRDGTFEAAVRAVLFKYGVYRGFPARVKAAAQRAPLSVSEEDLRGREDLRGELIFTIDGPDAKDLDDAVSLTRDGAGRRVLGVHIADVSHYVEAGTVLDSEAWTRGTSVYFADQVAPMLPPALSNGICSLTGGADRLCVSCFITVDDGGAAVDSELKLTVIHSAARMTYGDCNAILAGTGDPALRERYAFLARTLTDMNALAGQMRALRRAGGALDLDLAEGEIACNAEGKPIDVTARARGDAERLIEAFMLAANEAVAGQLFWSARPCVYRVHPAPDSRKLDAFYAVAGLAGLKVRRTKTVSGGPLQDILDQSRGRPCERVVHNALLRGMMKALYSTDNAGHFGLASDCYCHFTSPIRRYPDLMVHRCVKMHMGWVEASKSRTEMKRICEEAARQSSERELAADAAEREIERLYKALYMKAFEGEQFEGIISGVQTYGFFVELPNTVEGLVPVHTLRGDIFAPDDAGLKLVGQATGITYGVGDAVTVVCEFADQLTGKIDFSLWTGETEYV